MKDEKRITLKVTEELHQAAREKALKEKRPLSEVVRDLLIGWLHKDPPEEAKPK